jgi:hypothetical protein
MCDMVTLGGKDNGLEPGNHCVYRRTDGQTDGQPDSSIPPTTSLRGYNKLCKQRIFTSLHIKPKILFMNRKSENEY